MPGPYDLSSGNAGFKTMTTHHQIRIADIRVLMLSREAGAYDHMSPDAQKRYALANSIEQRADNLRAGMK